jgi:uncharacterized membrane protein YfhO
VKVLVADYAFRAISVPAGEHRVTLVYESSAYKTGRIVSLATLLLAVGLLAAPKR